MQRFKVTYTTTSTDCEYGTLYTDIKTAYVDAQYKDEVTLVLSNIIGTSCTVQEIVTANHYV